MPEITSILVPVDFSACSKSALRHAVWLADKFEASVRVLHTWEIPTYLRPDLTIWAGDIKASLYEHGQREATTFLEEFLTELTLSERPRLARQIECGTPVESILRAADEHAADMIVMGTHGRTGLTHLVLGSVAERVVRGAACPVLTVKELSEDA